MVNAWSTGASMSLGQVPTEEKSNEITVIPELLDLLNLRSCLVSIDAMSDGHCSKGDRKKGGLSLGGERKSERAL